MDREAQEKFFKEQLNELLELRGGKELVIANFARALYLLDQLVKNYYNGSEVIIPSDEINESETLVSDIYNL